METGGRLYVYVRDLMRAPPHLLRLFLTDGHGIAFLPSDQPRLPFAIQVNLPDQAVCAYCHILAAIALIMNLLTVLHAGASGGVQVPHIRSGPASPGWVIWGCNLLLSVLPLPTPAMNCTAALCYDDDP
jgi:hypothetical protein